MPELPEMINYARHLNSLCRNQPVAEVTVDRPRSLNIPPSDLISAVKGRKLRQSSARGKHLIMELDNSGTLACHLMLDGYLRFTSAGAQSHSQPQVQLRFADGSTLGFHRLHLGHLHYYPDSEKAVQEELADLGPDPLAPEFTAQSLAGVLRGRRGMIKAQLMDQARLSGLGNKYSDEALFAALMRPDRPSNAISLDEIDCLHAAIRGTLERAVDAGGGSEHPVFPGDETTGGARKLFRVHGREGQPCQACGHPIETKRISGRSSFYCPVCQS